MKRLALILLIVLLSLACRNSASRPPAAATPPAAGAASGQAAPDQPGMAEPVPAELPVVLARVNGEAIERWEFDYVVRGVEEQAARPIPPERRDEVFRSILDQLVAYHLLGQEARARKLSVAEADVKMRVDQIRQNFPSEDTFMKTLAAEGSSLEKLRRQTELTLLVSKVLEAEIGPKVSVQAKDIDAFYQRNLERFKEGEAVHVSHILIGIPEKADAAQKRQPRAQAEELLRQIRSGADFAQLARSRSQDSSSAARGGDVGFFTTGQMDPTFEAAAFALKPGDVGPVVETPYGFHIIKLHERRPSRTIPLPEVRAQIAQFLTDEQRDGLTKAFVDQLKARGKVEIYV